MSFASAILKSRSESNIWLVVAPARPEQLAWWFVRVDPPKVRRFEQAIQTGPVHFPNYGMILASGWGEEPPSEIVQQMRDHHGYRPASAA